LVNFGTNTETPKINYMTAAISIGLEREEIDNFFRKMDKFMKEDLKIKTEDELKEEI